MCSWKMTNYSNSLNNSWQHCSRRLCSAPTRSSRPGTTAVTSRTSPPSWPASTTSWMPPTARSACVTSCPSCARRSIKWDQSLYQYQQFCLCICALLIIYNNHHLSQAFQINSCTKVKTFLPIWTPSSMRINCAGLVTPVMLFSDTKPQSPSDYARIVELTSQWQLIFIIKQWII